MMVGFNPFLNFCPLGFLQSLYFFILGIVFLEQPLEANHSEINLRKQLSQPQIVVFDGFIEDNSENNGKFIDIAVDDHESSD